MVSEVASRILALPPVSPRRLVAVVGAPASGKSTLAEALANHLGLHRAVAVPMDGFHLDNRLLEPRGLMSRKGAPESFDGAGFVAAMRRLKTDDEVILPAFDRSRDIAVAGCISVGPEHRIAVVEGNYLCLNEPPWSNLAALWDISVYLDTPMPELRDRLVQRWVDHGLSKAAALARAEANDLPNARRVADHTGPTDLRLR